VSGYRLVSTPRLRWRFQVRAPPLNKNTDEARDAVPGLPRHFQSATCAKCGIARSEAVSACGLGALGRSADCYY